MEDFDFKDNHPMVMAMLAKPDGLLAIIDEQSRSSTADVNILAGESLFHLRQSSIRSGFLILNRIFGEIPGPGTLDDGRGRRRLHLFHRPALGRQRSLPDGGLYRQESRFSVGRSDGGDAHLEQLADGQPLHQQNDQNWAAHQRAESADPADAEKEIRRRSKKE